MTAEILIVDDDRMMRESLARLMKGEGYAVRLARDGEEALAAVAQKEPDLVLLDVMMPRMNGFATLTELRKTNRELPVIFLTAFDTDASEVRGFGCGADDFVAKDAAQGVLLARVARALSRARDVDAVRERFMVGTAEVDLLTAQLTVDGVRARLTRSECDVLRVLAQARGATLTKDETIAALRGQGFACTDNMLYTLVYRLRKKLGASGERLVSNYKTGYCLMKNVALSLVVVALVGVFGCGKQKDGESVARANGHVLTAQELDARAKMVADLTAHRSGKTNATAKIYATYRKGYAKYWVENAVLKDAAKAAGVVVPEETLELHRQAAFKNFRAKGDKNYAQLVKACIADKALWEDQVYSEALRTEMAKHWAQLYPTNFGDAYAEAEIAKMMAWNARMALTNAQVYAKATNVWNELRRGGDFVTVGKKWTELSDEAEDDCDWAVVDAKFLADDQELLKAVKTLKIGEYTPPIAADNGLMIARLDRFEEEGGYALSRIFFHLPRFMHPAPKKDIIKRAEDDYKKELFRRKLRECVSAAKVEYFNSKSQTKNKSQTKKNKGKGTK